LSERDAVLAGVAAPGLMGTPADEWAPSPGPSAGSTRRRLVAAFAAVLVVPVAGLVLQAKALRAMDVTLEEMVGHERWVALILGLEEQLREAFAHASGLARGRADSWAAYEQAQARAQDLLRDLEERLAIPEAKEPLGRVRASVAELDRTIREAVAPAALRRDPSAQGLLERSHPVLLSIDRHLDGVRRLAQPAGPAARGELDRIQDGAVRWAWAIVIALPLLVFGAAAYLWRSIAGPLARLGEGAGRVSRGDLDARIAVERADEFGLLAAQFNAMTAALQHHQARLVESEKLAGIGRLAAGVAHEINNPLQVMIGYLSLHRDHPDRRLAEHLAAAEEEAQRCKRIVGDLLELSRPAAPAAPVDLRALCEEVLDHLRSSVGRQGPALSVEGEGVAVANGPRVRQVVLNLVKNAMEAAGAAGSVALRIGPHAGAVAVSVADSGPGVPPEATGRLFEPFFTTRADGTGLGLAVSRSIARAFGGDVDLESGGDGGAVFRLRLPAAEGSV